jgi:indolepyruvate ferredoxin oxidoreductase
MNSGADSVSAIEIDDKYSLHAGYAFMTGTQALVRLLLVQSMRDAAAGLNTAGFVSGYRGSPLGTFDQTLQSAHKYLASHRIRFLPGLNEELAATAVWGSQQLRLFPGAKFDGVFALWYGKGPGVDRAVDALKHANSAGSAPQGGVVLLAGDDHAAKSSTLAHQSEHTLAACLIPVLYPASVQDYLDFGVHAYAMSRHSGCAIALKCVTDVVESAAVVDVNPHRVQVIVPPPATDVPANGLHIRWPDVIVEQESRLLQHKLPAVLAYCRANQLNRVVWDTPAPRLGLVAAGKAFADLRQALDDLGIDETSANAAGIRLLKIGMPWPLEPASVRAFAAGLEEILVVEEKRPLIESQLKDEFYNDHVGGAHRLPRIVGKSLLGGEWAAATQGTDTRLLPSHYELNPSLIAEVLLRRFAHLDMEPRLGPRLAQRAAALEVARRRHGVIPLVEDRPPYFCSGCPHSTSTRVPEGSRATAGIGCHFMSVWMDRSTSTYTQMGGEGAPWIGQAPFTETPHIFVNQGDGTYFHSGLLAIRAAVSAGVNCTYKILYNDAVAMTGGQRHDGPLSPAAIAWQLWAEGVTPIVIVTDDLEKYGAQTRWPQNTTVRHRDTLDEIQRELRTKPGVSGIVYDQTCAAEKRRRRKRNEYPDPPRRVVINQLVCEGCGDCGTQSNCLSIEPIETEFGRKRTINQSSCNKDFSCVKGFCPSFVTVEGGQLRRSSASAGLPGPQVQIREPQVPTIVGSYQILITGIGGTGVITIGQIVAMAAHVDRKVAGVLDMTGLAQKGGAVMSHVRLAELADEIHSVRVGIARADLVIGCDAIVTAGSDALSRMSPDRTRVVMNAAATPTSAFVRNADWRFPSEGSLSAVSSACGAGRISLIEASKLAADLFGDAIASNMIMLGYAWQRGWLPLSRAAIRRAIELNGVSVSFNHAAFEWGRLAAEDPAAVASATQSSGVVQPTPIRLGPLALDGVIEERWQFLRDYQNRAYADRYRSMVERVREAEERVAASGELAMAVARYFFKLMAYKDEYEVSRLLAAKAFHASIARTFEGSYSLRFHLAPPTLKTADPAGRAPTKRMFGPWMLPVMRMIARLRFLRGTRLDPFGRSHERRAERALIDRYEETILVLLRTLSSVNLDSAVAIASVPEHIRGYGHVKARHLEEAQRLEKRLLDQYDKQVAANAV